MEMDQRAKWMELAQMGDKQAYASLIKDIYGPIQSFVNQKIGFLGATEDIVQESLMAIHKARHSFDPERSFDSWMFAIVRFKVVDFIRKDSRRAKFEVAADEDVIQSIEDPSRGHEDGSESLQLLGRVIEELPIKYREAVKLVKLSGKSVKEAAKELSISEANVKTRCSRGYRMILKKIESEV